MIRRPPRSTQSRSSAASDVVERGGQLLKLSVGLMTFQGSELLPACPLTDCRGFALEVLHDPLKLCARHAFSMSRLQERQGLLHQQLHVGQKTLDSLHPGLLCFRLEERARGRGVWVPVENDAVKTVLAVPAGWTVLRG